jgi:hypothetical protein
LLLLVGEDIRLHETPSQKEITRGEKSMEASAFFEQSSQVKREADAFLEETKLLSFLQSYGAFQLEGSYTLDLMVNRDIDVYAINPAHSQDSTLAILHTSIQWNCFQMHLCYNSFQFPREGKPPGYYIGIKTPFRGNKWKVDI